jgi:hypothetical protein
MNRLKAWGSSAALVLGFVLLSRRVSWAQTFDPDRFFHLGLAKLTSMLGFVRTIPQVEDLGWGQGFPDKEFLFHQLLGFVYRTSGEGAARGIVPLLAVALLAVLVGVCTRYVTAPVATLFVGLGIFSSPDLFYRLQYLRPHMLAMPLFVGLLWAVLAERRAAAAITAALYALAYHAFYLPLLVLALAELATFASERRHSKVAGWGVVGVVVGVLVNPHFPGNVAMSIRHAAIALDGANLEQLGAGSELVPFSLTRYVTEFAAYLATLVAGVIAAVHDRDAKKPIGRERLLLLGLSATLLGLTALSPRGMEYALPVSVVLLAATAGLHEGPRWRVPLAAVAIVVLQAKAVITEYVLALPGETFDAATHEGIAHLPKEAAGQKVFNCAWETGSQLFYERPDVRFIDLLDPTFLRAKDPAKFTARRALMAGHAKDPYETVRKQFNADWVICPYGGAIRQLEHDPHFTRLFPEHPTEEQLEGATFFVYRVEGEPP